MSLTLHFHPLSSYCMKVLVALYENSTLFTPRLVNLMEEQSRAEFLKLWPIGKFPVLRDDARNATVPESSIIIEYLDQHYPGHTRFIPQDAERALHTRRLDRLFDLHLQDPMQKIVGDRWRPADSKDPFGVAQAKTRLQTAYGIIEKEIGGNRFATGDDFTMADCAASPALFYANKVVPFESSHTNVGSYFERLKARPSFKRALDEAKPYLDMFPKE